MPTLPSWILRSNLKWERIARGGDGPGVCVFPPPLQVGYKNPTRQSPTFNTVSLQNITIPSRGHQGVGFKKPTVLGI